MWGQYIHLHMGVYLEVSFHNSTTLYGKIIILLNRLIIYMSNIILRNLSMNFMGDRICDTSSINHNFI